MQKFNGSLVRQFPSLVTGNAAAGVGVAVFVSGTSTLASLFEDNGVTPKENPLTTDPVGFYSFKAADGKYRLQFSNGFPSIEVQAIDAAELRSDFDAIEASNAAFLVEQQASYNAFTAEQQAAYDAFVLSQGWDQVGTFAAGFTFTSPNQVGQDAGGNWWRWNGAFNKVVTAGTLPSSDANYKLVGDGVLRSDLAADGSSVIISGVTSKEVALSSRVSQLHVESFRSSGFSDSQTIQDALSYILSVQQPNRFIQLNFEAGRVYTYDSTGDYSVINNLVINLNGCTLKRANASSTKTTLAVAAGTGQTSLYLTSIPATWKVGDFLAAYTGPSDSEVSKNIVRILAINPELSNRITTNTGFGVFDGLATLPVGLTIAKKYQCFAGRPSTDEAGLVTPAGVNSNIHIVGPGTVDGNRDNQENYSWYFNTEMFFSGANCSVSNKIRFTESAGETIVGHGVKVIDNDFEDLNGSAFHTSMHDDSLTEATVSQFSLNRVKRTNLITQAVSGHCEGAVTFSWGAGRLIITNNEFTNGSESVLGGFGPSNEAENPDKWLIFSGNICEDYQKLFYGITAPVEGVVVTDNVLANCGDNSTIMSALMTGKTNTVANNVAVSGTILAGAARSTNASFGSITGALTGMQLAVGADVTGFDLTRLASYRAALMHQSSAFQALVTGDSGLAGFACFTPGGPSAGDLFSYFSAATNSWDFVGNDGSVIQRVKLTDMRLQLNSLNTYADNAAAVAAGLAAGDTYKTSTGVLMVRY